MPAFRFPAQPRRRASDPAPGFVHDMTWMARRLWMGAYPDAAALARLRSAGFTHVVFCAVERPAPSKMPPGMYSISLLLHDDASRALSDADLALVRRVAAKVLRVLARGGRVLVSCNMGLNRSGLLIALVLHELFLEAPADAIIAHIRRRKGPWGMRPLSNPRFVEAIRGFVAASGQSV